MAAGALARPLRPRRKLQDIPAPCTPTRACRGTGSLPPDDQPDILIPTTRLKHSIGRCTAVVRCSSMIWFQGTRNSSASCAHDQHVQSGALATRKACVRGLPGRQRARFLNAAGRHAAPPSMAKAVKAAQDAQGRPLCSLRSRQLWRLACLCAGRHDITRKSNDLAASRMSQVSSVSRARSLDAQLQGQLGSLRSGRLRAQLRLHAQCSKRRRPWQPCCWMSTLLVSIKRPREELAHIFGLDDTRRLLVCKFFPWTLYIELLGVLKPVRAPHPRSMQLQDIGPFKHRPGQGDSSISDLCGLLQPGGACRCLHMGASCGPTARTPTRLLRRPVMNLTRRTQQRRRTPSARRPPAPQVRGAGSCAGACCRAASAPAGAPAREEHDCDWDETQQNLTRSPGAPRACTAAPARRGRAAAPHHAPMTFMQGLVPHHTEGHAARPPGSLLHGAAKQGARGSCTVCATCSAAVRVAPGPDVARASCPSRRRRLSAIQRSARASTKAARQSALLTPTLDSMQKPYCRYFVHQGVRGSTPRSMPGSSSEHFPALPPGDSTGNDMPCFHSVDASVAFTSHFSALMHAAPAQCGCLQPRVLMQLRGPSSCLTAPNRAAPAR